MCSMFSRVYAECKLCMQVRTVRVSSIAAQELIAFLPGIITDIVGELEEVRTHIIAHASTSGAFLLSVVQAESLCGISRVVVPYIHTVESLYNGPWIQRAH